MKKDEERPGVLHQIMSMCPEHSVTLSEAKDSERADVLQVVFLFLLHKNDSLCTEKAVGTAR